MAVVAAGERDQLFAAINLRVGVCARQQSSGREDRASGGCECYASEDFHDALLYC